MPHHTLQKSHPQIKVNPRVDFCFKSAMARSGEEKSLLLHVWLYRQTPSGYGRNAWFVVKPTDDGPQLSEIFADQPINTETAIVHCGCEVIGSSLYIIGGNWLWEDGTHRFHRKEILLLETLNPSQGWKLASSMPYSWYSPSTAVVGDYMYLFNGDPDAGYSETPRPWMYFFKVDDPSDGCRVEIPPVKMLYENDYPVLVPVADEKGRLLAFFFETNMVCVHDPRQRKWVTELEKVDVPNFCNPCGVWEQILFYCDWDAKERPRLYAYNIVQRQLLLEAEFEPLALMARGPQYCSSPYIFPVAEDKLCVVWSDWADQSRGLPLCYARALINYKEQSVKFVNEERLHVADHDMRAHLLHLVTADIAGPGTMVEVMSRQGFEKRKAHYSDKDSKVQSVKQKRVL